MPLYEYQCPKCGRFEKIQKFSDPPLTICPTCSSPVEKLLAAPAIQFKGTGWYITDYARKSEGKGGKGKSGEAKSESKDSSSSGSSEKPAASASGSKDGSKS